MNQWPTTAPDFLDARPLDASEPGAHLSDEQVNLLASATDEDDDLDSLREHLVECVLCTERVLARANEETCSEGEWLAFAVRARSAGLLGAPDSRAREVALSRDHRLSARLARWSPSIAAFFALVSLTLGAWNLQLRSQALERDQPTSKLIAPIAANRPILILPTPLTTRSDPNEAIVAVSAEADLAVLVLEPHRNWTYEQFTVELRVEGETVARIEQLVPSSLGSLNFTYSPKGLKVDEIRLFGLEGGDAPLLARYRVRYDKPGP